MKRNSFLLLEVLVGIALLFSVSISIFSLEKNMSTSLQKAKIQLQKEIVYDQSLALLVEQLAKKTIPFSVIEGEQNYSIDIGRDDWNVECSFHIEKKDPENTPKVFLVKSVISVFHASCLKAMKTGEFVFCIKTQDEKSGL